MLKPHLMGSWGMGVRVGVGDTQQSFRRGVPPPGPTLTILYTISDRKGTPFVYSRTSITATPPFFGGQ